MRIFVAPLMVPCILVEVHCSVRHTGAIHLRKEQQDSLYCWVAGWLQVPYSSRCSSQPAFQVYLCGLHYLEVVSSLGQPHQHIYKCH